MPTNTTAPTQLMPTEADVPEIEAVAAIHIGKSSYLQVQATSGGVLVRYHRTDDASPQPALEAVGYTTTSIRQGLLLVTGAIDHLALLEAQIAALTAQRDALVDARRASELEGAVFVPTLTPQDLAPEGAR